MLLRFNEASTLSFTDLQKSTGIDSRELQRTLQSLSCAKIKLLSKDPKGRDVSPTDTFTLNTNFTNPHYRIKVNAIQIKETLEEQTQTTEKVVLDRVYVVDAAIVRIMKTRKTLAHELLIAELCEQLKFKTMVSIDWED